MHVEAVARASRVRLTIQTVRNDGFTINRLFNALGALHKNGEAGRVDLRGQSIVMVCGFVHLSSCYNQLYPEVLREGGHVPAQITEIVVRIVIIYPEAPELMIVDKIRIFTARLYA